MLWATNMARLREDAEQCAQLFSFKFVLHMMKTGMTGKLWKKS